MTISDFTINADPSADPGFDATAAQVLTLQLENLPATDVYRTQFSVARFSKDMPALVFSPVSGEPATPGGTVTVTCPATGTHSFIIDCVVNNGVDQLGVTRTDFRSARLVTVRAPTGLGKIVPGESTEYDVTNGWTGRLNEMIDAVDLLATATVDPTPDTLLLRGPSGEGKCTSFEASSGGELRFNISGTEVSGISCDGSKNLTVGDSVDAESILLIAGTNKSVSTLVSGTGTVLLGAVGAASKISLSSNAVDVLHAEGGVLQAAHLKLPNDAATGTIDAVHRDAGDILRIGEDTNALGMRLSISSSGAHEFEYGGTTGLSFSSAAGVTLLAASQDVLLRSTDPITVQAGFDAGGPVPNAIAIFTPGTSVAFQIDTTDIVSVTSSGLSFSKDLTASITQPQSTSGAGRTLSIIGQRGQAAFDGADLWLVAGDAGTAGANLQGNIVVELGKSGDLTGIFRVRGGASGELLTIQYDDSSAETSLISAKALQFNTPQAMVVRSTGADATISCGDASSLLLAYGAGLTTRIEIDTTGIGVFGHATAGQQADFGALTDNSGGTANNTIEALQDPADSPLSADQLRDDLVANLIPALRNNFADCAEHLNAVRDVLRAHGWMA